MVDYINALAWMADIILNDDTLSSESISLPVSESSIKTYVDTSSATTLQNAEDYADIGDADTLAAAMAYADGISGVTQAYVDTGDANTLSSAQTYADNGDATTLSSANAYTDSELAALPLITNGADELTTAEVDQLKTIDLNVIDNNNWNVVGTLDGVRTPRIIDGNPNAAWTEAFIPLTETITDTSTTFGIYRFHVWQDNGSTSTDRLCCTIRIPKGCFHDGTSVPPLMDIFGTAEGTKKFDRIVASNMGVTGHVGIFLVVTNNGDGILDVNIVDEINADLPTRLTAGSPTSTLANQTSTVYNYTGYENANWGSGGSVKISSNGDTSKPTYSLSTGVSQQVTYTAPIIDSTSKYPQSGAQDSTCIWDPVNNVFLENQVAGQQQTWRVTISYSGKSSNNNTGFYLMLTNPISGFTRRMLATLPSGETSNSYITFEVTTYSDYYSMLPAYGGIGLGGYEFWIESIDTGLNVIIEDIARFTPQV